jgi:uncharacterized cupin superfamily protein
MTVPEAPLEDREHGRRPAGDGWFVLNVADVEGMGDERCGVWTRLEPAEARFPHLGINIQVLQPGQPAALYHAEDNQEDFLVLAGECIALVEEQERRMHAWDFLHCPPGTRHIFIGAGDGPCAILMVGARIPGAQISYPVSELAARYGASVPKTTSDSREAYPSAGFPESTPRPFPWPLSS